jgi:hypothetical protein
MAAPRRKITAAERKNRDATERVMNLINVLVIRRLFDEGWTNENVALTYAKIQSEVGRIVLAHAMPGWKYVDETKAAVEVYESVTRSE